MRKRYDFSPILKILLLLLIVNQGFAQERYWVGGSGDWNDPAHWAFTSGGKGGASVPTNWDDVIVDENAFNIDNLCIDISGEVSCNSLLNLKKDKYIFFIGDSSTSIAIHGSINVKGSDLLWFDGKIFLFGSYKPSNIEVTGKNHCDFIIKSKYSYKLNENLETYGDILFSKGRFESDGFNIECRQVIQENDYNEKVSLESSNVKCNKIIGTEKFKDIFQNNLNIEHNYKAAAPFFINCTKIQDELCYQSCDGSFTVNLLAGSPNYNVSILVTRHSSCGGGTQVFGPFGSLPQDLGGGAGNFCGCQYAYSVKVRDADYPGANSEATSSIVIGSPAEWEWDSLLVNPTCNGGDDGSITITDILWAQYPISSWSWSNGDTEATADSLSAGISYSVTATDFNGCTGSHSFEVLTAPTGIDPNPSVTQIKCNGECTGIITLNPSGGSGTYTQAEWDPGGILPGLTRSNLCAGTYDVTVTDDVGCTGIASVDVLEPAGAPLTVALNNINHESCFGVCDGDIYVNVSGGTPPYIFDWDNDGAGEFDDAEDLVNECAGTWQLVVRDDSLCEANGSWTINPGVQIYVNAMVADESCDGACDGTVSLNPSGGIGLYTCSWADGPAVCDRNNLCPLTYTVTVTDQGSGCTKDTSVVVNPGPLININGTHTDETCIGDCDGTVTLSPGGGIGPYTCLWADAATDCDRTGLCAGVYAVTVTDQGSGCTKDSSFTILPGTNLIVTGIVTPETCDSDCNGAIDITVVGGTGPYNYLWAPGGGTDQDLTGLCPDTYSVTVTDVPSGCTGTGSWTVNPGATVYANGTHTDETCSGDCNGTITLNPVGGTAPYS
ncbi:MAG: SprB repeat-containing protein, partial [Bacteroidetes bacterium]|nr:SprB repeat-containing protein [Bacteroidota bacterium]